MTKDYRIRVSKTVNRCHQVGGWSRM